MLDHLRTWYLGCEGNQPVDPKRSEIIRLCSMDCDAYAPLVAHIGNVYAKAQLYHQERILNGPYRLSVLIPRHTDRKYKPQDPETMLDRIIWFIENLRVPDCGLIVSVYIAHHMMADFQGPFGWDTLWQTKQTWDGSSSKYITLQHHSEIDHNVGKSAHRKNISQSVEVVRRIARIAKYDIVEVDYTTPIDELYKLLLNSKCHFSYVGSTGYIAAITKTPTVYFGKDEQIVKGFKTRYYDPSRHGMPVDQGSYDFPVLIWNRDGSNMGLTMQYDSTYNKMYLRNPDYYNVSSDPQVIVERVKQALLS